MAEQPKFHHEGTKHTKKSETKKFVDGTPGNWVQERKKRERLWVQSLPATEESFSTLHNTSIQSKDIRMIFFVSSCLRGEKFGFSVQTWLRHP